MAGFNKYIFIALGLVIGLIGLQMITSVAQETIPDASESYYNLANGYNATAIGDGANSLATSSTSWLGYMWVVLPFALVVGLIVRLFRS